MTNKQHHTLFDWATELLDAEGHVTLSAKEAHEIGARLRSMGEKLKTYEDLDEAASDVQLLRMGYAAARLEIESLQARIKVITEEHADELMVALSDAEIDRIVPALEPVSEDFPAEWAVWKDRERIREELRASHGQAPAQAAPAAVAVPKPGERCQHCIDRHDGVYGSWAAPCPYHDDDGKPRVAAPTTQPAPQREARPVTPYTCPKCHALWLHWPAEQSGFAMDTLNCRSTTHCDYCEKGGVEQLQRLERVPAALAAPQPAPQREAQEPVMIYHGDCTIDCGEHGHHHVELLRMIPAGSKLYTAPQPATTPQADSQPAPAGATPYPMAGDEDESDLGNWQDGATKPTMDGTYLREFDEGLATSEFYEGKWLRDGFFPSDIQDAHWRGRNAPQPTPTPQADGQPAPDEIINMAREQGLPETEIEGVFRVNADDLCRVAAAILAARAPADSVTAPASGANWQDISTAPKDGTRFVAVGQNYGLDSEAQHTCIAQWFRGCWMEVSDWNEASELKYLTHWMPLPPLPGSAARKQGENHD